MKTQLSIVFSLLVTLVAAPAASAQWDVARFDIAPNRLYTTFGLDPAFIPSVGYSRVIPIFGHRFQLAGEAGIVAAKMDTHDFRATARASTSIVSWRSLHLTGSTSFITRGTDNSIYRGLNFGADLTGTLGAYRPTWFVAGEFGFDKAIITHVTHSEWYRTHFYSDARDGWYLNAGGTFHYGVVGGIAFGRTELLLRCGALRTEDFGDLTPPMYASLGLGFAF